MKDGDRVGRVWPRTQASTLPSWWPQASLSAGVNAVSGECMLGVSGGAKDILFSLQPCEVNVLIILFISQDCF